MKLLFGFWCVLAICLYLASPVYGRRNEWDLDSDDFQTYYRTVVESLTTDTRNIIWSQDAVYSVVLPGTETYTDVLFDHFYQVNLYHNDGILHHIHFYNRGNGIFAVVDVISELYPLQRYVPAIGGWLEYSRIRNKVSWATVPLFDQQGVLGLSIESSNVAANAVSTVFMDVETDRAYFKEAHQISIPHQKRVYDGVFYDDLNPLAPPMKFRIDSSAVSLTSLDDEVQGAINAFFNNELITCNDPVGLVYGVEYPVPCYIHSTRSNSASTHGAVDATDLMTMTPHGIMSMKKMNM